MSIRRISVQEVTSVNPTLTEAITCTPAHSPTTPGDETSMFIYNTDLSMDATPPTLSFSFDVEYEYHYEGASGATLTDYCTITGLSRTLSLGTGISTIAGISPSTTSFGNSSNINVTSTSVGGDVFAAFTVSDVAATTIFCVDDTACP